MFHWVWFGSRLPSFGSRGTSVTKLFARGPLNRGKESKFLLRFVGIRHGWSRGRSGKGRVGWRTGRGVPLALVVPRVRRGNIAGAGGGEGGVGSVGVERRLHGHGAPGAPPSRRGQLARVYAGRVCLQQQRVSTLLNCILFAFHWGLIIRGLGEFPFSRNSGNTKRQSTVSNDRDRYN